MRPIITLATVKTAVAALKREKTRPTCGNLYVHFGGRDSMTTINKYRREALHLTPLPSQLRPKKPRIHEDTPTRLRPVAT